MKWFKPLMLSVAISTATVMSGFAFDMEKDSTEWSSNPDCMVTMYLGMPQSEFENNFSDVKGWKKTVRNNYNAYYPCHQTEFLREEISKITPKVIKQERLSSIIKDDSKSLCEAQIYFCYRSTAKDLNYKKDILPSIEELRGIRDNLIKTVTQKYGAYTKIANKQENYDDKGHLLYEGGNIEWHLDGKERFEIFYSFSTNPRAQTIGVVSLMHSNK